jgi:hypothetical protein
MSRLSAFAYYLQYPSIEIPPKEISPESLLHIIARILNIVDLPAPVGPMSPKISPYLMLKETSLTISSPFTLLERLAQLIADSF